MSEETASATQGFHSMPQKPSASVAFVLATLGMDALGVGIIAPIVPAWFGNLGICRRSGQPPGSAP